MKHWQSIMDEVKEPKKREKKPEHQRKLSNKTPVFYLGEGYHGTYFTKREVESLYYLMQGNTLAGVARHLNLSPRTVEFYVNNMKLKLNVKTRSDLLRKVLYTDVVGQMDWVEGRCPEEV